MRRLTGFRTIIGLAAAIPVTGIAATASAGKVVCPVCGETHEDDVVECPNDGTDLRLVGLPAKEDRGEPEETADTDPDLDEDGEAPGDSEPTPMIKYKRRDHGGDRRSQGKPENHGYSDRISRIPKDPRYVSEAKSPREVASTPSEPFPIERDEAIRSEFERRRESVSGQRRAAAAAEVETQKSRDLERRRLYNKRGAPLTSMGFRVLWMAEGNDPGPVGGAEIDLNLARYRFRAGLSMLLGLRDLDARDELIFLGNVSIGVQSLQRFSPFIVARGGLGMMKTERFQIDQVYLITSLGVDVGLDSWVTPWLAITPSVGYMRCAIDGAYWHSVTGKLSIGF
jgi:hypothetical protein